MKKNIAIVITRLDLGGAQKVALYLAEHLDRKKYNVHFIAGKGGYLDSEVRSPDSGIRNQKRGRAFDSGLRTPDSGFQFHLWPELIHPIHPLADSIAIFKLVSYFKKNKIDIVHTHSSKAGLLGRAAAKIAGVKTIIHTIHGFPFHEYQNPLMHYAYLVIEKLCALITTKFVAVGRDVMEYGLKKGIGKREQYLIIRPGVDLRKFGVRSPESGVKNKTFLKKHGLEAEKFTVGMIGNCKSQKNPMAFAKIGALVLKIRPDTQFIFAGDGPLKDEVQEYLNQQKISDRVKFIGWSNEPELLMKSLDVFLLTSLWEGIPCTLAQAAAAGRRIVASDIAGNREFMETIGAAGFLYAPRDLKAAADMVIKLASDGCRSYRAKPEKILKEFDLNLMLKQHEKIYGETDE